MTFFTLEDETGFVNVVVWKKIFDQKVFDLEIRNATPTRLNIYRSDRISSLYPSSEKRWYVDSDNDGYGDPNVFKFDEEQPAGYIANNQDWDCNDADPTINPGAVGGHLDVRG